VKANSIFILALIFCASCGGGGSGSGLGDRPIESVQPAVASGSPGGYWVGVDSDGGNVVMLANEEGVFYFVAGSLRLGAGILSVSGQDSIRGVVSLPQDQEFPNQLNAVDCVLNGTLVHHQSMTLNVQCRQKAGQQVFTTFTLNYDPTYERKSSLEVVAGLFEYAGNDVMNISADGSIFSQDGNTGCVTSGTVVVKNSAFNVYEIELVFGHCPSINSKLRGRTLQGLSMLDDSVVPEELLIIVSTTIDSSFVSLMRRAPRL